MIRQLKLFGLLLCLMLSSLGVWAATPFLALELSPDITIDTGVVIDDEDALFEDGVSSPLIEYVGMPVAATVIGQHLRGDDTVLLAVDSALELPSTPTAITVAAGDVVEYSAGQYTLLFDASANGIPVNVRVDAVSEDASGLLLSFDSAVDLDGLVAQDEDIVRFVGGGFTLVFDGSSQAVDVALDLDAIYFIESVSTYALSFDGSGSVGGVYFDDEDILEYNPSGNTWELLQDASTLDSAWAAADINALSVLADPDLDGLWDGAEAVAGTDMLNPDSDGDDLLDGVETNTGTFVDASDTGTDPLDSDTDDDGFFDGFEVDFGSNPLLFASVPDGTSVPALPLFAGLVLALLMTHTVRSRRS